MKEEEYILFKKWYLDRFKKYYRSSRANKKELKRSVYDNKNLSDEQKDDFWHLVIS